jgi:chromosome segregation ATPase
VSDQRSIQFPSHDTLELTGEEVLASLRRVANVAEQNIQRAVNQAHQASMQLRIAEDKIARIEQEMRALKGRAERAEAWLLRISQEIDQTFPAREPEAYQPRRSNTGPKVVVSG